MTKPFPDEMLEATRLTRAGRLSEATALIRQLLGRGGAEAPNSSSAPVALAPPTLDLGAQDWTASSASTESPEPVAERKHEKQPKPGLPRGAATVFDALSKHASIVGQRRQISPADLAPQTGTFVAKSVASTAGTRTYKLYIPSTAKDLQAGPRPLIVMLHGCTQSADDFAAGTRMNFAAEQHGCLVAYPEQPATANNSRCWNWFEAAHQSRDKGEPLLMTDMVRQIIGEHAVDPNRVYVAGLSAGGAAAAVLADTYPDVFAAVGVHSGLACGVARDLPSAFTAMQGRHASQTSARAIQVPTIVFHGDGDKTVHPRNGADIVATAAAIGTLSRDVERGSVQGGHQFTRSIHRDPAGRIVVEDWLVHGAGHAWFGGSPNGSYTDPRGPDASSEMLRFFLAHTRSE